MPPVPGPASRPPEAPHSPAPRSRTRSYPAEARLADADAPAAPGAPERDEIDALFLDG